MNMPEKLTFTFLYRDLPDPIAPPYVARWEMLIDGKKYGAGIDSRKMDPEFIKAALDALYDEAMLCLKLLNEPLVGRNE